MAGVKDGRLRVAVGASRSGKTAWVSAQTAMARRVMIWDVEGQYPAQHRAGTIAELARLVIGLAGKPGRIAYTGNLRDFPDFCRVAFEWVKSQRAAGQQSVVIIEETSDVTSPGKAPDGYGVLIRRGLKYGADIYAISQRPAESDKTTFGNAGFIHCCRLALPRDQRYMAEFMACTPDQLAALKVDRTAGRWDYLQHDLETGALTAGVMEIRAGKPVFRAVKGKKPL